MPKEKRWSGQRRWAWLRWPLLVVLGLLFALIWWKVPPALYRNSGSGEDARLKAITDTRTALLAGLVGLGALLTFWANSRVVRISARTLEITERGQITERFSKAIEQLGNDKLDVRLGGIYALERIAKDSKADHQTVVEVLSAFIRDRSKQTGVEGPKVPPSDRWAERERPTTDLQAGVTVLSRLPSRPGVSRGDLTGAQLVGVELNAKHHQPDLSGAAFIGANLSHALLEGVNLSRAQLGSVDLSGAVLTGTDLSDSLLDQADLAGAFLSGARLDRANLSGARLGGADLSDASLDGADLSKARLGGAILSGTRLFGANLHTARFLEPVQLNGARIDELTQLPPMILREQDVRLADGRTLRVQDSGASEDPAVVFFHGSPPSSLLYDRWLAAAAGAGLRLVAYDRPGYGGSTPQPDRTVADVAADVAAIADDLHVSRFAVWGVSGGGPHALACAALLADRVVAAAIASSVMPYDLRRDAPDEHYEAYEVYKARVARQEDWSAAWFADMAEIEVQRFKLAVAGRDALQPLLLQLASALKMADPAQLIELLSPMLSPPDRATFNTELAASLLAALREGLAPGVEGWVEDLLALVAPWGVDFGRIDAPVSVWHGEQDRSIPAAHGSWLAGSIPGAELQLLSDEGHYSLMFGRGGEVVGWLAKRLSWDLETRI
jgi:uncharacterized protein YjbI with pentapeptide repeats/pimeloyl-ACP methyl ester carboxylesterase